MDALRSGAIFNSNIVNVIRSPQATAAAARQPKSADSSSGGHGHNDTRESEFIATAIKEKFDEVYRATPIPKAMVGGDALHRLGNSASRSPGSSLLAMSPPSFPVGIARFGDSNNSPSIQRLGGSPHGPGYGYQQINDDRRQYHENASHKEIGHYRKDVERSPTGGHPTSPLPSASNSPYQIPANSKPKVIYHSESSVDDVDIQSMHSSSPVPRAPIVSPARAAGASARVGARESSTKASPSPTITRGGSRRLVPTDSLLSLISAVQPTTTSSPEKSPNILSKVSKSPDKVFTRSPTEKSPRTTKGTSYLSLQNLGQDTGDEDDEITRPRRSKPRTPVKSDSDSEEESLYVNKRKSTPTEIRGQSPSPLRQQARVSSNGRSGRSPKNLTETVVEGDQESKENISEMDSESEQSRSRSKKGIRSGSKSGTTKQPAASTQNQRKKRSATTPAESLSHVLLQEPQNAVSSISGGIEWQAHETVVLYNAHAQMDVTAPDFWERVGQEVNKRGVTRSVDECREKWFQTLRDTEMRKLRLGKVKSNATSRPITALKTTKSRVEQVIAKDAHPIELPDPSTKKRRLGKGEFKRLAQEAARDARADDIFDSKYFQSKSSELQNGRPGQAISSGQSNEDLSKRSAPKSSFIDSYLARVNEMVDTFEDDSANEESPKQGRRRRNEDESSDSDDNIQEVDEELRYRPGATTFSQRDRFSERSAKSDIPESYIQRFGAKVSTTATIQDNSEQNRGTSGGGRGGGVGGGRIGKHSVVGSGRGTSRTAGNPYAKHYQTASSSLSSVIDKVSQHRLLRLEEGSDEEDDDDDDDGIPVFSLEARGAAMNGSTLPYDGDLGDDNEEERYE